MREFCEKQQSDKSDVIFFLDCDALTAEIVLEVVDEF